MAMLITVISHLMKIILQLHQMTIPATTFVMRWIRGII